MPYSTNDKSVFYASYFGCILGSYLPMVLGVLVAICISNDDIIQGIIDLTGGMGARSLWYWHWGSPPRTP